MVLSSEGAARVYLCQAGCMFGIGVSFRQLSEVLGGGCEQELVACASGSAETNPLVLRVSSRAW